MAADWDQRFLELADHFAGWSRETGRHVGCVIVGPDNEIRSSGYNGLPRGVEDTPERHDRETGAKYIWSTHAEQNAVYNAARIGVSLSGCTLYVSMHPCSDCAKAIVQSGIKRVVTRAADLSDPRWSPSFQVALEMFAESGITTEVLS